MYVFVLEHVHKFEDQEDDVKLIGVYSTQEQADLAVERLRLQPSFRAAPNGFCIDRYTIDEDNWSEGYVTLYPEQDDEATQ